MQRNFQRCGATVEREKRLAGVARSPVSLPGKGRFSISRIQFHLTLNFLRDPLAVLLP